MLRTPSVLVSNKALGLSLHASQASYLINFQGIPSEKISDIILCPHSSYEAGPSLLRTASTQHIFSSADCHQDYFLAFQHIYNNWSRLARAPGRSVSVKTPLATLGSPQDNEMETVAPVRIYNESDQHSYKLISSQ